MGSKVTVCIVQLDPSPATFSNQSTLPKAIHRKPHQVYVGITMSRSPSPSMSPATILRMPQGDPGVVLPGDQALPSPSVFSKVMSWAEGSAPITSRSPSPSMSRRHRDP